MIPDFALRAWLASCTLTGCLLLGLPAWSAQPARLLTDFDRGRAIIETSGVICLVVDLYMADTPDQKSRGLMYIEQMDEFEGMLFRHSRLAKVTMWMKNTYIPLDMFFIRPDGSIANIAKHTTPRSTRQISSSEPVIAVLELNAGFSDRWNIETGDRILAID